MRKLWVIFSVPVLVLVGACADDSADASQAESGTTVRTQANVPGDVQNEQESPDEVEEKAPAPPPVDSPVLIGDVDAQFPLEYFALGDDDEILLSSFKENSDGTATISLNARTPRATDDVISDVTKVLKDAGFDTTADVEVDGMAAQTTFTRASETITIGVVDDVSTRLITIGGTVTEPESDEK